MLRKIKTKWSNIRFKKLHQKTKMLSKEIVDEQIFDTNTHIAEFILPMLKQYKNHTPVKHEYMTEYEFIEVVDNMIYAFEFHANKDDFRSLPNFDRIEKGLIQFAENFCYFSW